MCYYTFFNENPLQRYTFFMIYANIFALFRSFGAILLGDSAVNFGLIKRQKDRDTSMVPLSFAKS